jgi:polar amino acid transport system substrate-binding protein
VDGRIEGLQVDIVRRMLERAGIPYQLHFQPFARAFHDVLNHRVTGLDAIFNLYKSPERFRLFDYTDPILDNPLVFYIRQGEPIQYDGDLSALGRLKIGVMRGYTYSPDFTEAIERGIITIDSSESHQNNFQKLLAGRIDVYPVERNVGWFIARQMGIETKVQVLAIPLAVQKGHVGFAKDNPKGSIIPRLNEALNHVKAAGEYDRLFHRHLKPSP